MQPSGLGVSRDHRAGTFSGSGQEGGDKVAQIQPCSSLSSPDVEGTVATGAMYREAAFHAQSPHTARTHHYPSLPTLCLPRFWPGFTLQVSGMSITIQWPRPETWMSFVSPCFLSLHPRAESRGRTASAPSHMLLGSPLLPSGPACLVQVLMAMTLHWSLHHASVTSMFSSLLPV